MSDEDLVTEWLGKHIGGLVVRLDVHAAHAAMLNLISNTMHSKVKMLGQLRHTTLLGNTNCSAICSGLS